LEISKDLRQKIHGRVVDSSSGARGAKLGPLFANFLVIAFASQFSADGNWLYVRREEQRRSVCNWENRRKRHDRRQFRDEKRE